MPIASGGRHGLTYIKELTPGVTPDAPQMEVLRHTGCTLNISRDAITSNELRSDRQTPAVRTMADKVQGAVNFEFSFGAFDTLLECALAGTWTNDVLKVGAVERSLTIERRFEDIGQYGIHRGCYLNRLSLSLKPNALVTGSVDVIGLSAAYGATSACAAPTPAPNNVPFDSFSGAITEGGATIGVVTGLDFTLENGIQPQFCLMRRSAAFVTWGRATCTGTLSVYFENAAMLRKFLDETPSGISLTLGSGTATSYEIVFPRVVYTGADNPANDDGPVSLSMPFSAIFDPAMGSNLKITRIA